MNAPTYHPLRPYSEHMNIQRRMAGVTGLAFSAAIISTALLLPAQADTESCVGRTEFDNTERGLTPIQIANRYDVYGWFLDDDAATFRRAYRTCWAPGDRKAVVVFSYDTGATVDWYIRDA